MTRIAFRGMLRFGFVARTIFIGATICLASTVFGQDGAVTRDRPDSKANRLLDALEQEYKASGFRGGWAWRLKELIELGPPAVPDLIAELDATDSDMMLRNCGFALRAIGDKRAVPALIRALPKTLKKPGSDMGLSADDKDLLAFMQKHDLDEMDRGNRYGFGRPVREISGALEKLTGEKQNEQELYHIFLQGGPLPQHMQRQLYRACAERWAGWWEKNWKSHVSDAKYSRVELPADETPPVKLFPNGRDLKISGMSSGHIAVPDTEPNARRTIFIDLDTGRSTGLPKALAALANDPHRLDKILDWAAREGFDLMGTYYQPAGAERPYYAIRGLGLTAWEIDSDRWKTIEAEIKSDKLVAVGRPAAGLLLHFDEQAQQYDPTATAAFLFVTRESTYGVLFVGVEVLDTNVQIGAPAAGDQELDPVGFYKGRRFSFKLVEGD